MLLLGFSSGLPFPMVLTSLSARLRQAGIDRQTIGFFSLVGLAYSLKYFWAPLVDRLPLPAMERLGRRRSWLLLAQFATALGLLAMARYDPIVDPLHMAWLAVITAFAAATQDITVDAYRIEAAPVALQGALAAAYQTGYQGALICAQAGVLLLAAFYSWTTAYCAIAAAMAVGMLTTMATAEPPTVVDRATLAQEQRVTAFLERAAHWPAALRQPLAWLIGAVVCPFVDFFKRNGLAAGVPILALVVTYRLNYMTMGVAANTFYLDMGYTLVQVASISKVYGLVMTIAGALAGGLLIARYGLLRTLLGGLLMLSAANLLYATISGMKPDLWWLAAAISVDNFGNGIAGAAFIAYMSSLTNTAYTATQYALFGTLWSLPAKSLASTWGTIVNAYGYGPFFIYTAVLGLPAAALILYQMRGSNKPGGTVPAG
jgi:PAT family beta-lactamase induction signal transducer AmpG